MQEPINHKEILSMGLSKAMENAQVPYKVLLGVIKQHKETIKSHNDEIKKHQDELKANEGSRKDHEKQIARYERSISQMESELERYKVMAKGEKGDTGEPGYSPSIEDIASRVRIPLDGKPGADGKPGQDGKNAEVDKDEIVKEVIDLLNKKGGLSIDSVKGIRDFVKSSSRGAMREGFTKDGIHYGFEELMHGGGGSSGTVSLTYSVDLSAQCNGSNKVFTVPVNDAFVLLTGSDAPIIYRPTVDYTGTGTTMLTLAAGVSAPSSGATLMLTYKST